LISSRLVNDVDLNKHANLPSQSVKNSFAYAFSGTHCLWQLQLSVSLLRTDMYRSCFLVLASPGIRADERRSRLIFRQGIWQFLLSSIESTRHKVSTCKHPFRAFSIESDGFLHSWQLAGDNFLELLIVVASRMVLAGCAVAESLRRKLSVCSIFLLAAPSGLTIDSSMLGA